MPILWRYLLSQYLRVLCLCTVTFIAVLFIMRLDELAHFITLGGDPLTVIWFILHQIPYILPIALPVSSLIASILLIQRLSKNYELTALRASGMAIRHILAPILLIGAGLALLNFYIVSEVATHSHLTSGMLKTELRALNPLLLAHNKSLMRLKGFYFDNLGSSRLGESAADVILAVPNKSNQRLNLLIAKELRSQPLNFSGIDVTVISNISDHLMIENIKKAETTIDDFSQLIQKKLWSPSDDHLTLPLLLVRVDEEKKRLAKAVQLEGVNQGELKQLQRSINRSYLEVIRRLSIALAAFTFTLMGAAFGISISRTKSNRGLYFVIGLASFYLITYFMAKGMDHVFVTSALIYLIPHLIIIALSCWSLRRAACGVE